MYGAIKQKLAGQLDEIKAAGLFKGERVLSTAQQPHVAVKGGTNVLNMCANKAFSILFTWLLDQPVKDTLCGTKVLTKEDYRKIIGNRSYFGDFDPFGDFDLLFGADKLNLKIADIPIRYQDRTYGQTNIQRWRHGLMLLEMVLFAARKLKFV